LEVAFDALGFLQHRQVVDVAAGRRFQLHFEGPHAGKLPLKKWDLVLL
jgi:hypothetical protein